LAKVAHRHSGSSAPCAEFARAGRADLFDRPNLVADQAGHGRGGVGPSHRDKIAEQGAREFRV
jgi:hypothetical protein